MTFLRDTLTTYPTKVMGVGLSALTNIIIARALGPQGRGDVAVLLLLPTFLVKLGGLSLGKASIYLVGKKKVPFSSAFWTALIGSLILGGSLTGLALLVYQSPIGTNLFQRMSSREVMLALCVTPLFLYMDYLLDLQRAVNHIDMFNWMQFQRFALNLLLIVVLLLFFGVSTTGAVVASAVGLLLAVVTGFIFLLVTEKPYLNFEMGSIATSLRAMITYGFQIHLMNLVGFLGYRFDVFLIKGLLDSEAVGFYMVAVNVAEMLWLLPDSIGVVLLPKVSQMTSEEAAHFTPLVGRTALLITAGVAFVVYIFAKPFVTLLYSVEFLPAVLPLRILLVGIVAFTLFKVLGRDLIGRGQALLATVPTGTSLVLYIGLNLILIPRWAIQGAAWASTISYLLATLLVIVIYLRTSGISIARLLMWTVDDIKLYRRLILGLARHLSLHHDSKL